jgi:hypothetical protein
MRHRMSPRAKSFARSRRSAAPAWFGLPVLCACGGSSAGSGTSSASIEAGPDTVAGTNSEGGAEVDANGAPHTLANVGWGMFNPNGYGAWASDLAHAESATGRHMDLAMDFADWSSGTDPFPTVPAEVLSGIGSRPLLWTVQPSGVNWANLVAGDYDAQLVAFADRVNSTISSTLYLRFAHEMNGTGWYNWQVGGSCGVASPANYAQGFNHVASVLKAHSTHILMVWAVNDGPTNNIANFYPSGCDIMGFDAYNFGPNTSIAGVSAGGASSTWADASPLDAPAYAALVAIDPDKPIWICETSTEEPSAAWDPTTYDPAGFPNNVTIAAQTAHDKGDWVAKFLAETDMPRVAMVVWFDIQKERDWLFDSSASSTAAFYAGFAASRDGGVYWNPITGGH